MPPPRFELTETLALAPFGLATRLLKSTRRRFFTRSLSLAGTGDSSIFNRD
jgi:hypothetical protein